MEIAFIIVRLNRILKPKGKENIFAKREVWLFQNFGIQTFSEEYFHIEKILPLLFNGFGVNT